MHILQYIDNTDTSVWRGIVLNTFLTTPKTSLSRSLYTHPVQTSATVTLATFFPFKWNAPANVLHGFQRFHTTWCFLTQLLFIFRHHYNNNKGVSEIESKAKIFYHSMHRNNFQKHFSNWAVNSSNQSNVAI